MNTQPTTTLEILERLKGPPGAEYFRNGKTALQPGRVYCHECDGFGQVRFRFGPAGSRDWKRCPTCEGKGQIPMRRPGGRNTRGVVYNGKPLAAGAACSAGANVTVRAGLADDPTIIDFPQSAPEASGSGSVSNPGSYERFGPSSNS